MNEGEYTLILGGNTFRVTVRDTIQGQWPETRELRMAHFQDEPRFPIPVNELLEWGSTFEQPQHKQESNQKETNK